MAEPTGRVADSGPNSLGRPTDPSVTAENSSRLEEQPGGPAPRGLAILLIGGIIALISPVIAFLVGTYADTQVALWLLVGIGVGAVGVLVTILGGLRLHKDLSHRAPG
jgi:hypothetical protein